MSDSLVYVPLRTLLPGQWPLLGLLPESIQDLWVSPPTIARDGTITAGIVVDQEITLRIPGLDFLSLALSPTGAGLELVVRLSPNPFLLRIEGAQVTLRVGAELLRPILGGTGHEPDQTATTLDINLGTLALQVNGDGDLQLELAAAISVPRCMVAGTGVILEIGGLSWLTPSNSSSVPNTPAGFTGLHFDNVSVEVVGLPITTGTLAMEDVFIGTGGFSGRVSWSSPLSWGPDPEDPSNNAFSGALTGELFGFAGGLSAIEIAFQQNALTGCEITGDVYVPYLEKRIGVVIGLDGAGGITAAAGLPYSTPAETGVSAGTAGHLLHVDVGSSTDPFLTIDIDSVRFTSGGEGPALIELSGALDVNIDGLDAPPFEFNAFRVDTNGDVAIDGGWLDLREAKLAPFRGFPLEITRLGFGKDKSGCFWVGLNGGVRMADGLPIGASVEGLRICWDPADPSEFDVSLKGVGIEFRIPNTLEFAGTVAFFDDPIGHGFRGSVKLTIISVNLTIDAQLIVGRTDAGDTFFYIYLAVDLPTGIPLFSTGAAIYGFAGLIATNMGPTRQDGEHWYYGWYLRNPKGVTSIEKWRPRPGAFAGGVGTTIGTQSDDGFAFSAKVLLVLLLPGPQFLLQGKGKFVKKRADSQDVQQEGNFDGLIVLDFPGKLFQANLAAAYSYDKLLTIEGGTDVGFSWAHSPPPDMWHVYLGEKAPPEKRIRAQLLKVLRGNSYFQLTRGGIETGTWVGLKKSYKYGPVRAWFEASVSGDATISWNPGSFVGGLRMVGSAGISAFRVTVRTALNSSVTAMGPRPWYLEMRVELSIEIDLWFFEFSETVVLPLTWGDSSGPLPDPVKPVLTLAAEHLKIDETFRLLTDNTEIGSPPFEPEIPPDARPVIIFQRPVSDTAQIGGPSLPAPAADDVGVRTFSYELAHVVLIRRDGGQRVLCAAGKATVSGNTATLSGVASAGLALPGMSGATLELVGHGAYSVTGTGTGTLTLAGTPPAGEHTYRLQGHQAVATVQVNSVAPAAYNTSVLILSANHGRGYGAFAGGMLRQGTEGWTIVVDTGTEVTVRAPVNAPSPGPATLEAASGGLLEGQWLPVDDRETADAEAPTTKLMLWARTPFAWFRRNGSDVVPGFVNNNPSYACGPSPVEEPVCINFDDLEPGRLPAHFETGSVSGDTTGTVKVVASGTDVTDRFLRLLDTGDGVQSAVTFHFMGPVEWVEVRYRADKNTKAFAIGRRRGAVVENQLLQPDRNLVELSVEIDELSIAGAHVFVDAVCMRPGWTCVAFDEKSIPAGSTGKHRIGEVIVETAGTMAIAKGGVLVVLPPGPGRVAAAASNDATGRAHSRHELLPGAPPDRVRRVLGVRANMPLAAVPKVQVRGVSGDTPTYLPGIGAAIVIPSGRPGLPVPGPGVPDPRDWRWVPVPLPERTLPLGKLADLFGLYAGTVKPVASVAFLFPHPITRVRVTLGASATVVAYQGTNEIARKEGSANEEVVIIMQGEYVDRLLVFAPEAVRIGRVCYDDGSLGWQLAAQDGWQTSLAHAIEWMYREDPILAPGSYRVEVVTGIEIGGRQPGIDWRKSGGNFRVGQPPGAPSPTTSSELRDRYPHGGPLTELSTYVHRTMPAAGQRPFYRSYDVAVNFNVPYVSRMFLAAGKQLSLVVVDSNDRERRDGAGAFWGEDSDLALAHEIADWIGTVNAAEDGACPTVDAEQVALHSEEVHVGAGELLASNELHAGEVRASGSATPLYRFEFVTSRFVNFKHHVATLDGQCRAKQATLPGTYDPQQLLAIRDAGLALGTQFGVYAAARTAAMSGSPTLEQLDAFDAAAATLTERREAFQAARSEGFDALWNAYMSEPPPASLPANIELSRVIPPPGSSASALLLLESPEPLPWDRIAPTIARSATVPGRHRSVMIDRKSFGAPDANTTFEYGGYRWTTDVELQVTSAGISPRVAGQWNIAIEGPGATSISVFVGVAAGGSARLHGEGNQVSPDVVQGPTAPDADAALTVTGSDLARVTLTGSGTTIVRMRVIEPFRPTAPRGPIRLVQVRLPGTPIDDRHFVDLTTYADVDLSGWSIRWFSAMTPDDPATYHAFATGTTGKEAETVRVYGAVTGPTDEPGVKAVGGGLVGTLPVDGIVAQLVDPDGRVVHEIATLPDAAYTPRVLGLEHLAVSADGTRAFVVPASGSTEAGQWRLRLQMARVGGADRPAFSVGRDTSPEIAVVQFTAV